MSKKINVEIQIMQDNLCNLRKIAGWTAEALANKLGVTKQTISNLELQKVKLSRIQYIAIRAIFECEVALSPENTTLKKVMSILFDMPSYYVKHKEEVRTAVLSIASISAAGISGSPLYSSAVALLAPLGHLLFHHHSSFQGNEPTLQWLIDALNDDSSTEPCNNENLKENTNEDN